MLALLTDPTYLPHAWSTPALCTPHPSLYILPKPSVSAYLTSLPSQLTSSLTTHLNPQPLLKECQVLQRAVSKTALCCTSQPPLNSLAGPPGPPGPPATCAAWFLTCLFCRHTGVAMGDCVNCSVMAAFSFYSLGNHIWPSLSSYSHKVKNQKDQWAKNS